MAEMKDNDEMSITDGVVLFALGRMPKATEVKLAKATGMNVNTVRRSLSRLRRLGYAEMDRPEGTGACTYTKCGEPPSKRYGATVCGKRYMLTAQQYHELREMAEAMSHKNHGIWGEA